MKVPVFIVRYALEKWDYPPFMYENYGIYLSKSQAISEAKKLYKKYAKEELLTVVIEQQKEVYSAIDGKKLSPDFEVLFRIDAFDGFHKVKDDEQYRRNRIITAIKKILGHYLELNPNYNELQGNQHSDGKMYKGKKQTLYKK